MWVTVTVTGGMGDMAIAMVVMSLRRLTMRRRAIAIITRMAVIQRMAMCSPMGWIMARIVAMATAMVMDTAMVTRQQVDTA